MTRGAGMGFLLGGSEDSPGCVRRKALTGSPQLSSIRPTRTIRYSLLTTWSSGRARYAQVGMARHFRGRGTGHGCHRGVGRAGSAVSEGEAPHLHVLADAGG